MAWVAVGTAVVGGAVSAYSANKQSKAAQAGSKQEADPRFNALLWGEGEHQGLLPSMQAWYEQNQSGLNPQMREGMNDQWGILTDPNTRAGYNNMSNLGASLMGAPVAGNPFTDGRNSLARPFDAMGYAAQHTGPGRTQMAPGLLASSAQQAGPQQYAARPQPVMQPVNFGGSGAAPGGAATPAPGPFSAPEPTAEPAPEPAVAQPAAARPANRPFDLTAYIEEFYRKFADGSYTEDDVAEFNRITGQQAG